jgi:type I restriction enzyme, S subunit
VLVCVVGATIGKLNLAIDCAIGRSVAAIRPAAGLDATYLYYMLMPFTMALRRGSRGSAQGVIGKAELGAVSIRVPEADEQARIVARVDELMRLCDALEAKGRLEAEQHARLLSTLLGTLTDSPSPEDLAANWQRVAAHFDLLLDRPEAVDSLEQLILDLAIRGRLVAQQAEGETAQQLVERVAGQSKSTSASEGENELGFALPRGWVCARFGEITINRDAERVPVSRSDREKREKRYDYYGASGVIDQIDDYLFDKRLLLIGEDGANLLNRSTPIAFFADGKYWVNNHAHVVDGAEPLLLDWLCLYVNAIPLEPYVTGTAQPKMNQAKLNAIPLAVPPLAEQQRIVARVAQLRRLCDDLRQRLAASQATQSRLAEALVAEATA